MNLHATNTQQSEAERIARVVLQYAARISNEKEISALIRLNADLARDLVGADRCSLWLLDEEAGELWTKVAHGTQEIRIPTASGIAGACALRNEPIIVNDVASNQDFFSLIDQTRGYRTFSVACVPLHAENKVIGVLQLLNKPGGFFSEDLELLRFLAVYAAEVIQGERLRLQAEAARVLRREVEIASEVQRRLFPQKFEGVRGLEYYGLCRPARIVSGDYFDFQILRDDSFALSLGDVSGKGFPAAVLMASIQTLLHSLLGTSAAALSGTIGSLNDAAHRICAPERFSTLFCGILTPERDRLRYVNAGHVPPLIVRGQDGHIERPGEGDIPVGLLPATDFHEHAVELAPGDLVVCVSDGVFDVQNPQGEFWDETSVEPVLRDHRKEPIRTIAQQLLAAMDRYAAGTEQFDDITISIVRIGGIAGH